MEHSAAPTSMLDQAPEPPCAFARTDRIRIYAPHTHSAFICPRLHTRRARSALVGVGPGPLPVLVPLDKLGRRLSGAVLTFLLLPEAIFRVHRVEGAERRIEWAEPALHDFHALARRCAPVERIDLPGCWPAAPSLDGCLRRHRDQMVLASAPMWVRAKDPEELDCYSWAKAKITAIDDWRELQPDERRRRNTGSERPAVLKLDLERREPYHRLVPAACCLFSKRTTSPWMRITTVNLCAHADPASPKSGLRLLSGGAALIGGAGLIGVLRCRLARHRAPARTCARARRAWRGGASL